MALMEVILVDELDQAVGTMEKFQAHRKGALHRAVTVYLFNPDGQLQQQRAREKYHCGGLWSNTCCGHPMPAEESADARCRLFEEMGLRVELTPVFQLRYRLPLPNGLIEHEFGHVFFGVTPLMPTPDPGEAMAWRWQALPSVVAQLASEPENFTPWFILTIERSRTVTPLFCALGKPADPMPRRQRAALTLSCRHDASKTLPSRHHSAHAPAAPGGVAQTGLWPYGPRLRVVRGEEGEFRA